MESDLSRHVSSFLYQDRAKEILPDFKGLSACLHGVIPFASAHIRFSPTFNRHGYGGLCRCGSSWVCVPCAVKVSMHRAEELRSIIAGMRSLFPGSVVSFVTLTCPHSFGDDVALLRKRISNSLRHFFHSRFFRSFVDCYGLFGAVHRVRAFESTYGKNGFHPHFHLVFFTSSDFSLEYQAFLYQWQRSCVKYGLGEPNGRGLEIKVVAAGCDDDEVSWYCSKWGLYCEMTGHSMKTGRNGSLSALELLRLSMDEPGVNGRFARLFRSYALAFKGVHQLDFTNGLRELVGLKVRTDEEIASDGADSVVRRILSPEEWRCIRSRRFRGQILDFCDSGASDADLNNLLFALLSEEI